MKYILMTSFLVLAQQLGAQNFGFFNKKNIVDVSLLSSYPLIYRALGFDDGLYEFGEDENGNYYSPRKDYLDLAYNINYFRSIKKGFSLGLEFEYRNIKVGAPDVYEKQPADSYYYTEDNNHYPYYRGYHQSLNFGYYHIIPKIEFSSKDGIFGMGVNHQIGAGVAIASLKDKDYGFYMQKLVDGVNFVNLTAGERKEFGENFFNYNNKFKFYLFTYSINFRKPITKYLMLGYGFKYNLSVMQGFRQRHFSDSDYSYWLSHREAGNQLYPKVMSNILQLKLGVTYLF